jgi:acyl-CoA dehydrogenase
MRCARSTRAAPTAAARFGRQARVSDAIHLIGNEAVQMFGGIGVTDEEEIGLFLKRARVAELTLGDAAYHRARFAALSGF